MEGNFGPSKIMVVDHNFELPKIMDGDRNFGPFKIMVGKRNFGLSQISVVDRNFEQSHKYYIYYFFFRWNIYYSRTLADEALYYCTIYPNPHDLGTAE